MEISFQLSEKDNNLFTSYAKLHGMTVSELVRQSVMEKIEDECDLESYEKAVAEYEANPKTYTLDEVEKDLGL